MKNTYISVIIAVTSLSYSDGLIAQNFLHNESISQHRNSMAGYKSDKKNCDLCVNRPKKNKTTQV